MSTSCYKKYSFVQSHSVCVFGFSSLRDNDQMLKLKRNSPPDGLNTNLSPTPSPPDCWVESDTSVEAVLCAGGVWGSERRWYTALQRGSDTWVTFAEDIATETHYRATVKNTVLHLGEGVLTIFLPLTELSFTWANETDQSLSQRVKRSERYVSHLNGWVWTVSLFPVPSFCGNLQTQLSSPASSSPLVLWSCAESLKHGRLPLLFHTHTQSCLGCLEAN